MPTKVYLDIKNNVVVEKTGSTTLTIPQGRAKFTLFGFYPIEDIESFTDVKIVDLLTEDFISDKTSKIQNSSGSFIGNTAQVKAYLQDFILRSDAVALQEEVCTKANQEIIISQNTDIDNKLNELNITQEDTQDIIKKELQENNKYLRKIYN